MPNDGKMIRGYMGRDRVLPITGFDHIAASPDNIQSLLVAAAARLITDLDDAALERVIVRSEARGGRRLFGIKNGETAVDGIYRNLDGSNSRIFENLLETLDTCIEAAMSDGCPIGQINLIWLHGESDRSMSRNIYRNHFLELKADVEEHMLYHGVDLRWCLVQASGTGSRGSGNFWPNRLSMMDLEQDHENIDFLISAYPYEQIDGAHFSGRGKRLLGENLGRIIALRESGINYLVPRPVSAKLSQNEVYLEINSIHPLLLDTKTLPTPDTTVYGFHASDRNRSKLVEVSVVDEKVLRLSFDRPPDPETVIVHYAYQHHRGDGVLQQYGFPVGRGCLRTTLECSSIFEKGSMLHDWAAAFSVHIRDLPALNPS